MAYSQIDLLAHGFGADYNNGKAYVYAAGTTTLLTNLYTDSGGTTLAANPVTLNSSGVALVYTNSRVRIDVKNSAGVSAPGFPIDNIGPATIGGTALINVAAYGSKTATTITTVLALVDTEDATLYFEPGVWAVTTDLVFPSHVTVRAEQGADFSISTGKSITIAGTLDAGEYPIFSGLGTVSLSGLRESYARWFGVVGDGTADDSAPAQNAINSLANGGVCYFPAGTFKVALLTMKTEVVVEGVTSGKTKFIPASNNHVFVGPANANCVRFGWRKLWIYGTATKATYTAQDGIHLEPSGGYFYDTVTVENVVIEGCGARGWYSYGGGSGPTYAFIQRLYMNQAIMLRCGQEAMFLDGLHYETTFRDTWATESGDKTTYSNARFGSKTVAADAPHRLTWIGGGITQTTLNTSARLVSDANITGTDKTLTSATAAFVAGDVGTPVVISFVGSATSNSPCHITTIASRTSATEVELTDACPVTVTNGKCIINTPITGGLFLANTYSVSLIGLEIEECGAFIIVEGVVSLANQLTGCSMIGSSPAFAGVWFRGSNSARFKATSWSIFTSDYVLWGVLGSTYVGAANGNMVGIDIDQPQTNGQIVHGLVNLYDVVSVDSNAIKVTRPEMSFVRVAANANAINSIIDEHSVGTVFRAGQIITLQPIGGTIVVADGAGNIVLSQGENYTLANNAFGADRLTLQWDVISQKWIEIARSEINHPWIKVTSATTMRIPNVATHGDNTAAKAAGLVDGDLYRGATGALFVVYT